MHHKTRAELCFLFHHQNVVYGVQVEYYNTSSNGLACINVILKLFKVIASIVDCRFILFSRL